MAFASGTRVGPYEIISPLGAGGMGEVYRARDTRLDRLVAIKVLPPALAGDPHFRARFDREARAISALEHPNICALYDVGRSDAADFLVMQFIDGETLGDRLSKGPLPLVEALDHAIGIAAALDHAHTNGILHRDLKPSNVMLARGARQGPAQVKLLDFGLAKGIADALQTGGAADVTAPAMTRTSPLTAEGSIVGTFQYMAPEQIEGQEADTRSDIWAFGCVLYEILTGRPAFEGRSRASLIGAIMKDEPPRIAATQPLAPAALDHVVRRCVAKSPEDRWQHIRDVLAELRWIRQEGVAAAPATTRNSRRTIWLPWVAAAVMLVALVALAVTARRRNGAAMDRPVALSLLAPDEALQLMSPAISPDGSRIVFGARGADGMSRLWLRSIDADAVRLLPQTEDATYPLWSPDGAAVAFFAHGKLKTTTLDGVVRVVADAPHGRGATWNAEGVIVFAPEPRTHLFKVRAAGGSPEPVTQIDRGKGEVSHRLPVFLPGGHRFLYMIIGRDGPALAAGSLDGAEQGRISGAPGSVLWADTGHLVFRRGESLVAQAFDPGALALSGEPVVLAEGIGDDVDGWGRSYSVSRSGALVARAKASGAIELTWFNREGNRQGAVGQPLLQRGFSLSPDAGRVVVARFDERTERSGIWLLDALSGTGPRLTAEREGAESPQWSPDGGWIAFVRGHRTLVIRSMKDGHEEDLVQGNGYAPLPLAWSADSRALLYSVNRPETRADIFMVRLDGDRKGVPVVESPALEDRGTLSPDQRWIAYSSDQTGRREIFVQRVPSDGRLWQVSTEGGDAARWSREGRELYFRSLQRPAILAVPVKAGTDFEAGAAFLVFQAPGRFTSYESTRDGRRFLLALEKDTSAGSLKVILNPPSLLKKPSEP